MTDSDNSGGGCSCVGLVLLILMVTAIGWGLPMPGNKKINIDIFPPRIWDMNEVEAGAIPPVDWDKVNIAPVNSNAK